MPTLLWVRDDSQEEPEKLTEWKAGFDRGLPCFKVCGSIQKRADTQGLGPGFPEMLGTFQCLREGSCFYEHNQRPKIRENSSGSGDFTAGR